MRGLRKSLERAARLPRPLADAVSRGLMDARVPALRTSAYHLSMGGTNSTNSQSSVNQRYFVKPTVRMGRWRIKLANYDVKNSVAGAAFNGVSIYFGPGTLDGSSEPSGNFASAPQALVTSAFTIPGDGSYYVSPWFDAPMEAGQHYVVSVGFSLGVATPIFRGYNTSAIGFGGTAGATHAGDQTPNLTRFIFSFLDAIIEYEASPASVGLFIGDSLTECYGGDAALGMQPFLSWANVAAGTNSQSAIVNGITGSATGDWTSGTGNKWTRIATSTYAPNFAVVALGSNDASASLALASYQANIETIVGILRNTYGIQRIYLATVMPRSLAAGPEAIRQSYNAWIRTAPLSVNGVFDFDAAVRDPAAQSTILAAYRFSDNVHLTRAGYAALAPLVTA